MRPEGEGWIKANVAAKMLGVREDYVKQLVYRGELAKWEGNGKPFYYRVEDVERLAREPERVKRLERRETAAGKRRTLIRPEQETQETPQEQARNVGMITAAEAAALLGVSRIRVGELARRGQLACWQENPGKMGSPFWFRKSDVEARQRRQEEKANRVVWAAPKASKPWRRRYLMRQPLKLKGRLDVWDVSVPERYLADWLTARQVASLLHVSVFTVYAHRAKGHLEAQRRPEYGYHNQLMFRKREVKGLMDNEKYFRRRALWEAVHSERGKTRRREAEAKAREEAFSAELEDCWRASQGKPTLLDRMNAGW